MRRTIAVCLASICLTLLAGSPETQAANQASRPESAESYISFVPLNVSVVQNLRVRGMLQVEIGLDVPDDDLRDRALMLNARLQDAYVQSLQFYSTHRIKLFYTPNVEEIALTLQAVTDKVLGKPGARVLLSQVMLHKPF